MPIPPAIASDILPSDVLFMAASFYSWTQRSMNTESVGCKTVTCLFPLSSNQYANSLPSFYSPADKLTGMRSCVLTLFKNECHSLFDTAPQIPVIAAGQWLLRRNYPHE